MTIAHEIQDLPQLRCETLCEAFQLTWRERPGEIALRTPGDGVAITWAEFGERVERIAGGLAAAGVQRGDTVAIMLLNRPEFHLVDAAAMHLGATTFSVYNTSTRDQVEYLFSNAGNRVLITQREFLPTVEGLTEQTLLVEELEDLEDRTPSDFHFEQTWRAVEPADILCLIYTSGTTGPPKGVQLTHRNLMAEIRACSAALPATPGGRTTSFLPAAHIADRWANQYTSAMTMGHTVTCIADPRAVVQHLPEVRPTVWGAVPRIWEKLEGALRGQGIEDPANLPEEARAG